MVDGGLEDISCWVVGMDIHPSFGTVAFRTK